MGKNGKCHVKKITQKLDVTRAALEQLRPFANYGMAVADKCDAIRLAELEALAKISGIPVTYDEMMLWLREAGYFMSIGEALMPRIAHILSGLFEVVDGSVETVAGQMQTMTPLVTGKGQVVLLDAMRREFGTTTNDEEDTHNG